MYAPHAPATALLPARAFSTAHVPPEQRLRAWEEHNADALIALECRTRTGEEFQAREDNVQLGRVHLARVRSTAHTVERSPDLIGQRPTGAVALFVSLRGDALFEQAGRRQILRPGDLLVCDADGHFVRGFGHGLEELALRVDRRVFPEGTRPPAPGQPLIIRKSEANPYGRAITRLVGRAVGGQDPVPDERTVVDLLSVLVSDGTARPHVVHRALACAYIEDRLRDPHLSVPEVARAVGISVRQLTRVFADMGETFPRHVLRRRLELAHSLLAGPHAPALSTAAVSAMCGFRSAAHFSGTFQKRFGIAAGELRRAAAKRV
ncbi:MAG TPA: helix-turn-helix domain-containing protein [Streptomyces sp.]|uniref:helix-turn-helix domain-containing protein n=1 Tax=Streptomyces sp. TaxID=1931 RepID=UPI002C6F1F9F|nr:helix-turn-helix domain-containing protein [Streptomyces sp.]HWU06179.1 helix-turn-helix domain-containing protein [Streptomyces sp.]